MATMLPSTLDTILREAIYPKVLSTDALRTGFLKFLEEDTTDIAEGMGPGGRYLYTYFLLKTQRALGGAPKGFNQALPASQNPAWVQGYVKLINMYATGEYAGPVTVIKDSMQVVDGLADMMKDVKLSLRHQQNALFTGNSNAALALLASSADNGSTITYTCTDNNLWPGARRLRPGMAVDSYNGLVGAGTNAQGINSKVITDVTSTTFTVTEASATGTAAEYVFFEDGHGTFTDNVPQGICGLVDGPGASAAWLCSTQSCENIDGTSTGYWQSSILHNSGTGRYLTRELIADMARAIELKMFTDWDSLHTEEGAKYAFLSRPEIKLRYEKDMSREQQFVNVKSVSSDLPGTPIVIKDREARWLTDDMLPGFQALLVNTKDLAFKALPVRDLDAGKVDRVQNYDVYRKQFARHAIPGVLRRNSHAKCLDLLES